MINTLKEALERINELEAENKQLLSELEYYRNRNYGGRKKHNEAWMTAYNDFVVKFRLVPLTCICYECGVIQMFCPHQTAWPFGFVSATPSRFQVLRPVVLFHRVRYRAPQGNYLYAPSYYLF